mmetsp:Transcript_4670/g.13056  ORF Transcript_4670/g.13056 Transcript_4670/m.13056 type:complete len:209 (+) Transcript_4670:256-882(+)
MLGMPVSPQRNIAHQRWQRHEKNSTFRDGLCLECITTVTSLQEIPNRMCPLTNTGDSLSLSFSVTQKVSETARVDVIAEIQQVASVDLKGFRIQLYQLVHAVQKLHKDWRYLPFVNISIRITHIVAGTIVTRASHSMSTTRVEGMSKGHKVLFHETGKAFHGPVVRVEQQLRYACYLGCSVPSMRAMKKNWSVKGMDPICRFPSRGKD